MWIVRGWKWLRLLWLLAIPISLAVPIVVEAATSSDVTVTAVGWICGAPGGLTLIYINDYEVGISWVKGVDADNTMIRAAYGRYPTDRADGYLVYYGNSTTTSDTGVSLDETATPVYYRAWSENAGGVWNELSYAESFIEGIGVTLLAFLIAAIGLTIGGYWLKNVPLVYGAGGVWAVLAGYSYQQAATVDFGTWDTFGMLFWIAVAMIIVCMVEPIILRGKKVKALAEEVADLSDEETEAKSYNDMREQLDRRKELYQSRRARRIKQSKFARTGEVE